MFSVASSIWFDRRRERIGRLLRLAGLDEKDWNYP